MIYLNYAQIPFAITCEPTMDNQGEDTFAYAQQNHKIADSSSHRTNSSTFCFDAILPTQHHHIPMQDHLIASKEESEVKLLSKLNLKKDKGNLKSHNIVMIAFVICMYSINHTWKLSFSSQILLLHCIYTTSSFRTVCSHPAILCRSDTPSRSKCEVSFWCNQYWTCRVNF